MRLIDLDNPKVNYILCSLEEQSGIIDELSNISEEEPVDAAHVVRCKDCEYWSDYDWRPLIIYTGDANHKYCETINTITHSGFYCPYGERKDNTDE